MEKLLDELEKSNVGIEANVNCVSVAGHNIQIFQSDTVQWQLLLKYHFKKYLYPVLKILWLEVYACGKKPGLYKS